MNGINDPQGDGTWFTPSGNLVFKQDRGINTVGYPASYFDVSGFNGSQQIAMRLRENGNSFSAGMLLGSSSGSVYLGAFASAGGSPLSQGLTHGKIRVIHDNGTREIDLGTTPTRLELWNALEWNPSSPKSRTVVVEGATGTTLRPGFYPSGFKAELFIEGVQLYTDTADAADVDAWLSDPQTWEAPGVANVEVTAFTRMTSTRIPPYATRVSAFSRITAARVPVNSVRVSAFTRIVCARKP